MITSQKGIDLIKQFEGLRLRAYKALLTEQFYTIGYGHYGADVNKDMSITAQYAETLLKNDLKRFEAAVERTGKAKNQAQFDSLVSFCYNCGEGNLKKLVSGREGMKIADAMLLYNRAGSKELAGLTRRRKLERELFISGYNTKKTASEVAVEVIDGKWGNGTDRKKRLAEAGYDYVEVQKTVNQILKEGK